MNRPTHQIQPWSWVPGLQTNMTAKFLLRMVRSCALFSYILLSAPSYSWGSGPTLLYRLLNPSTVNTWFRQKPGHGLQHSRLTCLSPTPRACSNSCPLSRWCHPTISSSVVPFSSCLQSFPASGSFPKWVSSLHQVAKVLEFLLQHQSFQWIFRTHFL